MLDYIAGSANEPRGTAPLDLQAERRSSIEGVRIKANTGRSEDLHPAAVNPEKPVGGPGKDM